MPGPSSLVAVSSRKAASGLKHASPTSKSPKIRGDKIDGWVLGQRTKTWGRIKGLDLTDKLEVFRQLQRSTNIQRFLDRAVISIMTHPDVDQNENQETTGGSFYPWHGRPDYSILHLISLIKSVIVKRALTSLCQGERPPSLGNPHGHQIETDACDGSAGTPGELLKALRRCRWVEHKVDGVRYAVFVDWALPLTKTSCEATHWVCRSCWFAARYPPPLEQGIRVEPSPPGIPCSSQDTAARCRGN
ncbi:hypothetical protein K504DRAFT_453602 [Pleomassaria siparia CBS 279.74]|uniref:Uncharacterized protein n=1 Tax=Pleomassaria siparia CBS 279.74 TaxID=1314801 RepID=A0A6G1KG47_9PLEO|nr:hypothetical protein K504DRAFT_453602 [Pleomassaria siparia CBS 279.74]